MFKWVPILTAVIFSSTALSADKDFIWSEFTNGTSKILYSSLDSGSWSEAEVIVDDGKINDSPSIATDADDSQLVVWSYSTEEDSAIAFRARSSKDTAWTETSRVSTGMDKNLTPTLVTDPNGGFWLFWVGNSDANTDEIFTAYFDGKWSAVTNISEGGNTFDFDPVASINTSGNIQVSWVNTDRDFVASDKAKQLVNGQWLSSQVNTNAISANLTISSETVEQSLPPEYDKEKAGYGSLNDYQNSSSNNDTNTIMEPTL